MKILVTGGLGAVGTYLVKELRSRNYEVWVCDLSHHHDPQYIRCDVSQYRQLERIFNKHQFDYAYHLAAEFGRWNGEDYYENLWTTNVIGTKHLIRLQERDRFRMIFFSSSEVYGDYDGVMREDVMDKLEIKQLNDYAMTKWVGEMQVLNSAAMFGTETVRVRLFNSILKDQFVPIYLNGELQLMRVEDGYSKTKAGNTNIATLGFDPKTGKMGTYIASHIIREKVKKDGYLIKTKYGRKIKVTGDHSVFVRGADGLPVAVQARDLKIGDRIAIPKKINVIQADVRKIIISDELQKLGEDLWNWYVDFEGLRNIIKEKKDEVQKTIRDSGIYKGHPSKLWLAIAETERSNVPLAILVENNIDIPDDALISHGKSTKIWIPNRIKVTNDLLWLLGFYTAEGCSQNSSKGSILTFDSHSKHLEKAQDIIQRAFMLRGTLYPYEPEKRESPSLRVHGKAIYAVFDKIFGGVGDSHNVSIPGWIMSLPLSRLKYYLQGYYDGDGLTKSEIKGSLAFTASTVSEILANQLVFCLARYGIVASIQEYESKLKGKAYPFYRVYAHGLSSMILDWDEGVEHRIQSKWDNDIVWANIKQIEKFQISDYVYDFSVPNVENFLAGNMILCHNTYGPGEYYSPYRSVICLFIYRALHDIPYTVYLDHHRTSTYITDTVRTLANIVDNFKPGEVYNIGGMEYHDIKTLSDIILDYLGKDDSLVTYKEAEPLTTRDKRVDITKAIRDLKLETKVSLREGIPKTIEWMKKIYHK